jgi:VWFA-related protein
MKSRSAGVFPGLLLLCAGGICFAMQSGGSAASAGEVSATSAPATFRSGTNLVQVTAVIRNRDGQTVGNLTADDFRLFDNGKPQAISRFAVTKLERSTTVFAPAGGDTAAPGSRPSAAQATPDHYVAYVVDDVGLVPEYNSYAVIAGLKHLDDLGAADRAGVFTASGNVTQDFTADLEQLRKAFSKIGSLSRKTAYYPGTGPLRMDLINERDMNAMSGLVISEGSVDASDAGGVLAAIRQRNNLVAEAAHSVMLINSDLEVYFKVIGNAIAQLATKPGERSIVLLSPGTYIPPRFRERWNEIVSAAVRVHGVINAVDPRGVVACSLVEDPTAPCGEWGRIENNAQVGFMEDVTSATGGTYVRGDNDIAGALRLVDRLPEFLYTLSFSPHDLKLDGQYHALKVELKRSSGLTVQARRGYYAASFAPDPASQAKQQMEELFFSTQESTQIPIRIQTQFFRESASSANLTVIAQIDVSKLPLRRQDGRNRDDLTMVIGLFDQNGNYVSGFQKEIQLHFRDESLANWRQSGVQVDTDFPTSPGRYLVRLVIRDSEGQQVAAQSTGVEIPW